MIKGTPELVARRREEIVNACEKLYRTMNFGDITLKVIGSEVPFSRPTIYNYFHTKEEIFLALFTREYDRWNADLEAILNNNGKLSPVEVADMIAASLQKRVQLLKLLAMNNYDMEKNSRQEILGDFKASYGRSMEIVKRILNKFIPEMDEKKTESVIYVFFPFMFGIYPYTSVTDKQKKAMSDAGVEFRYQTVYELTFLCLSGLLSE